MVNLEVIGTVSSPVTEGVDEDWGSVVSEIRMNEKYVSGLRGLDRRALVLDTYPQNARPSSPIFRGRP